MTQNKAREEKPPHVAFDAMTHLGMKISERRRDENDQRNPCEVTRSHSFASSRLWLKKGNLATQKSRKAAQ